MIRVLIGDDHAVVRQGLKQILSETSDIVVADEAASGHEVFDKALKHNYDIVLLDISMPGRGGIDVLHQLRIERPRLPVLVLSIHSEEQYALRALKAGAFGYLTKASAPEELIAAIRKVSLGKKYISSSLAERLASRLDADMSQPPHEKLSDREFEVFRQIASGKTVKEIAAELSLSVKTVSTYRARVLEKMQMKNNAELTQYALRNQVVE